MDITLDGRIEQTSLNFDVLRSNSVGLKGLRDGTHSFRTARRRASRAVETGNFDADFWAGYASSYENLLDLEPYRELQEAVARQVATVLEKGGRVLDLGCGTGVMMALARQLTKQGTLVGIDWSEEMLSVASQRLGAPSDRIIQGSIADGDLLLDSLPDRVDLVTMTNSLYALSPEEAETLFKELPLYVKDGGRILITDPKQSPHIGAIIRQHRQARGTARTMARLIHPRNMALLNYNKAIARVGGSSPAFRTPEEVHSIATSGAQMHNRTVTLTKLPDIYGEPPQNFMIELRYDS